LFAIKKEKRFQEKYLGTKGKMFAYVYMYAFFFRENPNEKLCPCS